VKYGKWLKLLGPIIVLGGIAAVLLAMRTSRTPAPSAVESGASETWNRYTTADGACGIEFPQPPTHKQQTQDGDTVDSLDVAVKDHNVHYALTFSDISATDAALPTDKLFDLLRAIYATTRTPGGVPARLMKEQVIADRGFPGREYQFVVGDHFVSRIKVFVNGRRVYRAIAVNPPDERLDRDAQRFIDSFHFEITKP
jgi:hypothetical protein